MHGRVPGTAAVIDELRPAHRYRGPGCVCRAGVSTIQPQFQQGFVSRLVLLVSLILSTVGANAEALRITTGEWPPYIGGKLANRGLHAERVIRAFERAGITVDLTFYPWKRAYQSALKGTHHGTMLWRSTAERVQHFHVSEPVAHYQWVFFYRSGEIFDWSGFADLREKRVGAIRGFLYSPDFDGAIRSGTLNVQRVSRNRQLIEMLLRGRVDLVPMELRSGYHFIRRQLGASGSVQITHHPRPVAENTLHLLLSRKFPENADRIARFNAALAEMSGNEGAVDAPVPDTSR